MIILGIETSCDETAVAVVEGSAETGVKILSNVTATSAGIHAKTGGIIPEDAARKQLVAIIPVIDLAIKEADLNQSQLDAISVTYGPGLIGSLLVGVETAKSLSLTWQKPIVPINHLVGHIYANWINNEGKPRFPLLALVVSGGHTDLVLMKDHGNIQWISGTRDDAAGEAFDKTARLLGLPYPGGPEISKLADKYLKNHSDQVLDLLPRPMIADDNLDWSFSGLKTATLNEVKKLSGKESLRLADYNQISKSLIIKSNADKIAAEIQEAIVDVLVNKTLKAIEKYKPKSFLLAGGVAANQRLKEKFVSEISSKWDNINFHVPEAKLCTDNAAVIATSAIYNYNPIDWSKIIANPSLAITEGTRQ